MPSNRADTTLRVLVKRLEVMVSFQPWTLNAPALIGGIGKFNQTTGDSDL